ncbi:MAG: glycosyltransferase family 1 protein [Fulvivirga sp.]|uniref:glycosyltransferase family 4 protein n=1 Tax=Fulvivirga sp. TaxID=1931237 RepID=UPI0032EC766E
MILAIDASNITTGGGITHLVELLKKINTSDIMVNKVYVWSSQRTLDKIPEFSYLFKRTHKWLNRGVLLRFLWQKTYLPKQAKLNNVDILLLPAGNDIRFSPTISMCQNLLPFENAEKARFGLSLTRIRLEVLKLIQLRSFKNAEGVIFLSDYSKRKVENMSVSMKNCVVIPHGVSEIFETLRVKSNEEFNDTTNILYVSSIDQYKHQWNVVKAVYDLIDQHYKIKLTLIGPQNPKSMLALNKAINVRIEYSDNIVVIDKLEYNQLPSYYGQADLFVYASSCETFGMTVLEAMRARLPIACSSMSSMPEILGDTGIYFDPLDIDSIGQALKFFLDDKNIQNEYAFQAYRRSKKYSWEKCANQTIEFISDTLKAYNERN